MKINWKRVNRGLILAGVTIVAVGGYVVADQMLFTRQKPAIEQTLHDYMDALTDAAVPAPGLQIPRSEWSEADLEHYIASVSDVVREYWTDTFDDSTAYTYYTLREDMLSDIKDGQTDLPEEVDGYATDYHYNISKLSIRKNGPGAATFSFSLNLAVNAVGNTSLPSFGETMDFCLQDDATGMTAVCSDPLYSSADLLVEGELLHENGAWKISYLNNSIEHISVSTAPRKGGDDAERD